MRDKTSMDPSGGGGDGGGGGDDDGRLLLALGIVVGHGNASLGTAALRPGSPQSIVR